MIVSSSKGARVRKPAVLPRPEKPVEMQLDLTAIEANAEAVREISIALATALRDPDGDREFTYTQGKATVRVLLAPWMQHRKIIRTDVYVQCPDGTQMNVQTPYPAACLVFALLTQAKGK